jgi:aspartate/methionine/tyrosine aminotransferase
VAGLSVGRRVEGIPGFGIDRVAEAAGSDPEVLRLENLDTDVPPYPDAVEVTRAAVGRDEANSYLPFSGLDEMKEAVAWLIRRRGGPAYDPYREVVITQGDGDNMLNALLALTDPGDEVVLTDPTYAGMIQRVRLVGAVPRLVPMRGDSSGWRLDLDALHAAVSDRTQVLFLMNPAIPSGWVANDEEWTSVTGICCERGIILLYHMLMEAIVFGGRPVVVPSGLDGMRDHRHDWRRLVRAADDRLARGLDGCQRRARADALAGVHLQRCLHERLRADRRSRGNKARRR